MASARTSVASMYAEGVMIAVIGEALALLLSATGSRRVGAGARDCSLYGASVCVRECVGLWAD